MTKSDVLGLLAACCVSLFAFAAWPPACLLVVGLVAGWMAWVAA